MNQLAPTDMARIYFERMHFRSIAAVVEILKTCERGTATDEYWNAVFNELKLMSERKPAYRGGTTAVNQEGEVHV